eukprot:3851369-Rhodomonas_salina.4
MHLVGRYARHRALTWRWLSHQVGRTDESDGNFYCDACWDATVGAELGPSAAYAVVCSLSPSSCFICLPSISSVPPCSAISPASSHSFCA